MSDVHQLQSPGPSACFFRTVLEALSKPGQLVDVPLFSGVPAPLHPTSAALAVALCDYQTPVWLAPNLATDAVRKFLRFETGAPLISDRSLAAFAIMQMDDVTSGLDGFNLGTHEYPDRSTTLIIQCEGFSKGVHVQLSGPGLKQPKLARVSGATLPFWKHLQENHASFPLGIDVFFSGLGSLMGLPRSTRVALSGEP